MTRVVVDLSADPAITSALCKDGCPSSRTWQARCCRAYRPRFDTPAILALIWGRKLHVLSASRELYTQPLLIVVDLQGQDRHCGLWTPSGCRLPSPLRPQSCRDYFCRIPSASRNPAFCEAYRKYLAVVALTKRCQEEFSDLWPLAQRILHRDLLRDGVGEEMPPVTDSLKPVMEEYGRYRQHLREHIRTLLGADEKACSLTIDLNL